MNYHFLRSNTFAQPENPKPSIISGNSSTSYLTTYNNYSPYSTTMSNSPSSRTASSSNYHNPAMPTVHRDLNNQYDRVLFSINQNNSYLTSNNSVHTTGAYSNIYDTIKSIGYNNSYISDLKSAQLEQALLTPNHSYASRSKSVSLF